MEREQIALGGYSSVEFPASTDLVPLMPTLPECRARYLKADEWQPQFQRDQRVTPADLQKFRLITIERFQFPWIERWMNRIVEAALGISRGRWLFTREEIRNLSLPRHLPFALVQSVFMS